MITKQQALDKLVPIHQEQLLAYWDQLTPAQQQQLLSQIAALDPQRFQEQRALLTAPPPPPSAIAPFIRAFPSGNTADHAAGLQALHSGEVGCILMAGGMGTRLGSNAPKGTFPTSVVRKASLFQLFAEKTKAASKQAGRDLPLAIMTSPLNHRATLEFFAKHRQFGLSQQQLTFFTQEMLPFLDQQGNLFLEDAGQIAEGPSGNAFVCQGFTSCGLAQKWKAQGIRTVLVIQIDNPLADPFDAELIGFHLRQKADISLKCTKRRDAEEKVGVLAMRDGKACVIEYLDLPEPERSARDANGELIYSCANLSLFCFSREFLEREVNFNFPLHCALKTAKSMMAWKFEQFLFDLLPQAHQVSVLLAPRESCFAPLKNSAGLDSLQEVQKALEKKDRARLQAITGHEVPNAPLELSQQFYYPTPELLKSWQGKSVPPDASFVAE